MDSFFPLIDGVVMVMDNYAKRLSKTCDVIVVTPEIKGRDYVDDFPYKVRRVKSFKIPIVSYSLATPGLDHGLIKELIAEKFDIIHIHSPFIMGRLGVEIGKKLNIPVIGTMHSQFKLEFMRYTKSEFISKKLLKYIMKTFNSCTECWAVNQRIAEIFVDYGANVMPKVANNGTEMVLLDKKECNKIINEKYGLNNNEFIFLFVGRINILKNITFITEVMKYFKEYKMKFKMLFVGSGPDEQILRNKIDECEVNNEVILVGEVKDRTLLAQIYNRADMFIFPSLFDASSLVQVEAASQKTPTIFIEGAATANTVIKNQNGFMAPNDPELFAIELRNILKNKKLYNEVSEKAYQEIYRSWDTLTEEVIERYQEIIKRNK